MLLAFCSLSVWARGYREQVALNTLIGSRAMSIWLKVEADSQFFAQPWYVLPRMGCTAQDGVHCPGQGASSVLWPIVCKWMAHAQAAEKSVGDSHGSLWAATLKQGLCGSPGATGTHWQSEKGKSHWNAIEILIKLEVTDFNARYLALSDVALCCCQSRLKHQEAIIQFRKMNQKDDFPQGCRW